MSRMHSVLRKTSSFVIALAVSFSLYTANSVSADIPIEIAQGPKSSGNEVLKAVEGGQDFKGMTKDEVVASIGEPWRKDTTPEKGRYDEKWIYSCQTNNGLTYDCVYLYFMASRVVNIETF